MSKKNKYALSVREMDRLADIIRPNMDNYGLIGHIQDGGQFNGSDSCNRTFSMAIFYYFLLIDEHRTLFKAEIARAIHLFEHRLEVGTYRRHPLMGYNCGQPGYKDHACWNDPRNFSADQARAMMVVMQLFGYRRELSLFKDVTYKRGCFQNGDTIWLPEFAVFIRGQRDWLKYPFLWVCDAWLCASNLMTVIQHHLSLWFTHDKEKIYTDGYINGLLLALSTRQMPTPFGWLARKIIKIRVHEAWAYYFRHEGAPKLNVFVPYIKCFL